MMSAPVNHGARAVLGLGSNLGDRMEMLQGTVDALVDAPGIDVVALSPVYETEPVGGPEDQPRYLNAVLIVTTSMSPRTRPHPTRPGVAAKWDLVAWCVELGTAYS